MENLKKSARAAARFAAVRRRATITLGVLGAAVLVSAGGVFAGAAPRFHAPSLPAPVPRAHVAAGSMRISVGHSYKNDSTAALRRIRRSRRVQGRAARSARTRARSRGITTPPTPSCKAARRGRTCPRRCSTSTASPSPASAATARRPTPTAKSALTQYVQIVNEGLQVFNKTHRRLGPRPGQHRHDLDRLRRRLRDQRRRRPGRALRPARQPLAGQPVRRPARAHRRVHRRLDHQRRHRHLVPLRLPPGHATSSTTRTWRLAGRLLHER